ncbi:hypothetical protein [Microbulbifer sp. RZ01]|nr:hypothetical protein [Microbulbifer sp. RZ01]
MPPFQRHRADYLDDEEYRALQNTLMRNPEAGDEIEGTGGLRKLRFRHKGRGKGTRGGLRVIYYWYKREQLFWLFVVYSKGEAADLTPEQKAVLKTMLKAELKARRN